MAVKSGEWVVGGATGLGARCTGESSVCLAVFPLVMCATNRGALDCSLVGRNQRDQAGVRVRVLPSLRAGLILFNS